MFLVDSDSLDDRKKNVSVKPKTRQEEIAELKNFTSKINSNLNRGYKHCVASGLYNEHDRRKSGYFMRNASLLFDTFG